MTLLDNQRLHGGGSALTVNTIVINAAGANTTMVTTAAATDAITLASGNTVRGFTVGNTTGIKMKGLNFGTLTIGNMTFLGSGAALNLNTGTANGTIDSLSSTSSGVAVSLSGIDGNLAINGGAISGATSDDFFVGTGTGTISYAGTISNSSGTSVNIQGHTGGTVTFSGLITDTAGSSGVRLGSNAGATINFTGGLSLTTTTNDAFKATGGGTVNISGSSNNIDTTTGTGLILNGVSLALTNGLDIDVTGSGHGVEVTGGTTAITGGGLDINATSGNGFRAVSGGYVSLTGSTNVIATTTGTALNVANTTIGASGLTFQSISAGSASGSAGNGINLDTTGSSGGLTVTGTGSAGSGGTIQHKTGADASTTAGIGIYLNNTKDVSLSWMQLNDFDNYAIRGKTVTGFTLANSVVNGTHGVGNSAANDEGAIYFSNLLGSASITNSTVANTTSASGAEVVLRVINDTGTLDRLTIDGSTIFNSNASNSISTAGDDAMLFESLNSAVMKLTVNNSHFTAARADLLQTNAANSSTMDVVVTGTEFKNNNGSILSGGGGTTFTSGGVGSAATFTFNISNNTFRDARGVALNVFKGSGNTVASGTIANNTIGVSGVPNSGTSDSAAGINAESVGSGVLTVAITGNTIRQYNEEGIRLVANSGDSTLNATVLGNTVAEPGAAAFAGFFADVGSGAGDTAIINLLLGSFGTPANQNTLVGSGPTPADDVYLFNDDSATATFNLSRGGSASGTVTGVVQDDNVGNPSVVISGTITLVAGNPPLPLLFAPNSPGDPVSPPTGGDGMPGIEPTVVQPTTIDGGPTVGQPTTIDGGPTGLQPPVIVDDGILNNDELNQLIAAAVLRWKAAGASASQLDHLAELQFQVVEMPGWYLGGETDGQIFIDTDAAGYGWFIDATPEDDSEFTTTSGATRLTGGPGGKLDLLTTVMHEMGHAIGLNDSYSSADRDNLMFGYLVFGERRLPGLGQADGVVAGHDHDRGLDLIGGPINIGTLYAGSKVQMRFDAKINDPVTSGTTQVSNQGTVSGGNFASVLTDDPSVGGSADPTVTPIPNAPPDVTTTAGTTGYIENGASIRIDTGVTIVDPEQNYDSGTFKVQITGNALAQDRLSILEVGGITLSGNDVIFGGQTIGTASATTVTNNTVLTVTLSSKAGDAGVQALARAIGYDNTSNAPSTLDRTVTFTATDAVGASDSGTREVGVTAVNDAPAGTDNTVTATEDSAYTFAASDFGFSDATDAGAHAFFKVKITTVPVLGKLTNDGVTIDAGDFIAVADINANKLVYESPLNASGTGYASFQFQVQDDGGTDNFGVDLDQSANTMTIDVAADGDPVTVTSPANGNEGVPIGLTLALQDTDGSEVLRISGATGATFNQGTDKGGGVWEFTNAELGGLTITVADNGTLNLTVGSRETSNDDLGPTSPLDVNTSNVAPTDPVDDDPADNTVSENAVNGTGVGITASSMDVAGDTITYSLTNNAGGRFTIDGALGVVTVLDATLLDGPATHTITIQATDEDTGASAKIDFTIDVTNEAPTVPVDTDNDPNTIAENVIDGTLVQITASATDNINDIITYVLVDNAGGRFQIDGGTGVVTVLDSSLLDGDTSYTITVRADDEDTGKSTTADFTIDVTNVAPTQPTDTDGDANTVAEGAAIGTTVGVTANSIDVPGDTITYVLTDDAGGRFAIDPTTGEVSVADPTLLDGPGSHTITVRADDEDTGQSVTTDFTIDVTNVDPTATFTNDGPKPPGQPITFTFSNQFDPSTADTTAGFHYAYDWDNDGTFDDGDGTYAGSSANASVQHTFATPGQFVVVGRIIDEDGGFTDYSSNVNVNNPGIIVTGTGPGTAPRVNVYDSLDGKLKFSITPYEPTFRGGVTVASGDVNGDLTPDIITGPASRRRSNIKVFDGVTGLEILSRGFLAFGTFTGGVTVAAGDVNADGFAEIIVAPGSGMAPHVRVISGKTGLEIGNFLADAATYRSGLFVAAGDVNNDGKADVITGHATGVPRIRIFNVSASGVAPPVLAQYNGFNPGLAGGVLVAAGDVDGDGFAEVIATQDKAKNRKVRVLNGLTGAVIREFEPFVGVSPQPLGLRVAVVDCDGDNKVDIVVGSGTQTRNRVRRFKGTTGAQIGAEFTPFDPGFNGGVYVG